MLNDTISFNNLITSFESTLYIEIQGDMSAQEIVEAAIDRLENVYAFTLDRDVFAIQAQSQLMADNLNLLLKDVKQCLAELSLYNNLKLYHCDIGITLSDVNYMSYSKTELLNALRYLFYKREADLHHDDIIPSFYNNLNTIPVCSIKRLFIILLVLDKLGIPEGVAVVAKFLYIGGLVE